MHIIQFCFKGFSITNKTIIKFKWNIFSWTRCNVLSIKCDFEFLCVMGKYWPFVYQYHCLVYFELLENSYFLLVYQYHYVIMSIFFSTSINIYIHFMCFLFFSSYNTPPIFYIIIIFLKYFLMVSYNSLLWLHDILSMM